ncbi:putative teichuronic acid biosynthesis glycosyl transferase TuaH [Vibrio maritimus]|uniref:Putative teichuronic acid biosynthesis glycosyl transferase TuaH n=1 Tax=Vibrio maritimus TaxID=990268 RepID=A0A090SFF8_9VIBR|nr:putative teichuronic acid biosynthesis glycosyl transferase TuaH [Vibrio maritimus]
MDIALYSISDKVKGFHRLPFIKQLNRKIENEGGKLAYFKRPRFFLATDSDYRRREKVEGVSSYPLYTLVPVSKVIGCPLLLWLLVTLPIKLQVNVVFRNRSITSRIDWLYKPDQYLYLKGVSTAYAYTHYDNYDDDKDYYFSHSRNYEQTLRLCVQESLVAFTTGERLLEKLRDLGQATNVCYLPNAVSDEWLGLLHPDDKAEQKAEVIGFVGTIDASIDEELIEVICQKHRNASVRLIGRVTNEAIEGLSNKYNNLQLLGQVDYLKLPSMISDFTVGLVPYKESSFNAYRNPLKLYEYCACGIPAVSVACDFERSGRHLVSIANDIESFLDSLEQILSRRDGLRRERTEFAEANTWSIRAHQAIAQIREHQIKEDNNETHI